MVAEISMELPCRRLRHQPRWRQPVRGLGTRRLECAGSQRGQMLLCSAAARVPPLLLRCRGRARRAGGGHRWGELQPAGGWEDAMRNGRVGHGGQNKTSCSGRGCCCVCCTTGSGSRVSALSRSQPKQVLPGYTAATCAAHAFAPPDVRLILPALPHGRPLLATPGLAPSPHLHTACTRQVAGAAAGSAQSTLPSQLAEAHRASKGTRRGRERLPQRLRPCMKTYYGLHPASVAPNPHTPKGAGMCPCTRPTCHVIGHQHCRPQPQR